MNKERYFTESPNRTHTLLAQIKTKTGNWIDYEKFYSQAGFNQKDYILTWRAVLIKANFVDRIDEPEIRLLNGMRKQVYGKASYGINMLFGGWGSSSPFNSCPFTDNIIRPFAFDAKIASIRFKNSELADIFVTDIETEDGWKKFVKVLQDISFNNSGFKSFTEVELTSEDNNLHWYKIKCNSGLQLSFALYA
jgi:hypothetical protein